MQPGRASFTALTAFIFAFFSFVLILITMMVILPNMQDKLRGIVQVTTPVENLQAYHNANVRAVISFDDAGNSSVVKDNGVGVNVVDSLSDEGWKVITWKWHDGVLLRAYLDNFRAQTKQFEWHQFSAAGSYYLEPGSLKDRTIVLLGIDVHGKDSTVPLPF